MIKYTTLWEIMKDFDTTTIMVILRFLGELQATWDNPHISREEMTDDNRKGYLEGFQLLEKECLHLGLDVSVEQIQRIIEALSSPDTGMREFERLGHELSGRLIDEMKSRRVFSIERDKQYLLLEKNLFGAEVTTAFPSAIVDIEEAGKCLAFERTTACVFHLMRVMEVMLRVLEHTLKLPPSINPTWENILRKCDEEQAKPFKDRSPEWQKHAKFLADATVMLRSVKEAWRNPTMHVERVYTEEQAQDIWNAVKGFTRRLATQLSETGSEVNNA